MSGTLPLYCKPWVKASTGVLLAAWAGQGWAPRLPAGQRHRRWHQSVVAHCSLVSTLSIPHAQALLPLSFCSSSCSRLKNSFSFLSGKGQGSSEVCSAGGRLGWEKEVV